MLTCEDANSMKNIYSIKIHYTTLELTARVGFPDGPMVGVFVVG